MIGQRFKSSDGRLDWRTLGIKDSRIRQNGILKIITKSPLIKLGKLLDEGLCVSCPEDDDIDIIRIQRDEGYHLRINWIRHSAITFAYPVYKPIGIKSRNIRPPACAYYHLYSEEEQHITFRIP
jgi:hypothetical protein